MTIERAIKSREKQVDSLKAQLKILKGNGSGDETRIFCIEDNLEQLRKAIANLKKKLQRKAAKSKK